MNIENPSIPTQRENEEKRLVNLAKTMRKALGLLKPETRQFILTASDAEFQHLVNSESINPIGAQGFRSLRQYYLEQKNPIPETCDDNSQNENPEENIKEIENKKIPEKEKVFFRKTETGDITYYILKGDKFTYESGLIAGQNKFKTPPIRYPTEEEAKILLKEFQKEFKLEQPIACFIKKNGATEAFLSLNMLGNFVEKDRGSVPVDTKLFVIVVAVQKK